MDCLGSFDGGVVLVIRLGLLGNWCCLFCFLGFIDIVCVPYCCKLGNVWDMRL